MGARPFGKWIARDSPVTPKSRARRGRAGEKRAQGASASAAGRAYLA